MKKVRVGLVGAGFIAKVHVAAFKENDTLIEVKGVCASRKENAEHFAKQYNVPMVFDNFEELCQSHEIDVVDICTPTNLHDAVIRCACENNKHIICEKPLTGYFGEDVPDVEAVGAQVTKAHMYKKVMEKVEAMEELLEKSGVKFMYAENWVYAPALMKMKKMIQSSQMVVFDIRAECSHSGSQALYSRRWRTSGGGSLMRLGSHPVAAVLDLKAFEGTVKNGKPIRPVSVYGEIASVTKSNSLKDKPCYVVRDWFDVEDWSLVVIEFEDGSRATVFSTDVSLGGVKNRVEIYGSTGMMMANITPNNSIVAYAPNDQVWGAEYISEKLETKAGYSFPSADEFWTRGYPQEMKDFALSVLQDREPVSGFELAKETTKIMYAAYLSAEEGRKIRLL